MKSPACGTVQLTPTITSPLQCGSSATTWQRGVKLKEPGSALYLSKCLSASRTHHIYACGLVSNSVCRGATTDDRRAQLVLFCESTLIVRFFPPL